MTATWAAADLPEGPEPSDVREARVRAASRTWSTSQRVHPGDVSWSAAAPEPDRVVRRIWTSGERLVAWAYAEGDAALAYVEVHVDPTADPLLGDEVMAWCRDQASVAVVPVLDRERHLLRALKGVGAQEDSSAPWFVHQCRALSGLLPQPLMPAGYRVRPVRSGEEDERVAVHRRSWAPARVQELAGQPVTSDAESSFDRAAYDRVIATTLYWRDLDVVVQAPDGRLVATALGWFDPRSRSGLIEPVGTDPSYAVRGLGRAACAALLVALAEAGATRALVCPRGDDGYPVPRHLYSTLGMTPVARTRTYQIGAVGGAA
ncbi:GNAT family N-acetyltransferase [Luteipulveratus mongoliensis]|uniref:GNAT family N-acetyltransferase n=1 Tax=Luteipulveratus mongoliensis TaxID=571913 RepID=UPI000696B501|nr:GNAT family N-acetyltransferase [Luteipulveratus mongoliensis]